MNETSNTMRGAAVTLQHHQILPLQRQIRSKLIVTFLSSLFYSNLFYSSLLYSTLLFSTLLYSALLFSSLLYSTLLCSTLRYSILILLFSALLYSTILDSSLLYAALLYSTLLHSTLLYSSLVCSTLIFSSLLFSTLLCSILLDSTCLPPPRIPTNHYVFQTKCASIGFIFIVNLPVIVPDPPDSLCFLEQNASWVQCNFQFACDAAGRSPISYLFQKKMCVTNLLRFLVFSKAKNASWVQCDSKFMCDAATPTRFLIFLEGKRAPQQSPQIPGVNFPLSLQVKCILGSMCFCQGKRATRGIASDFSGSLRLQIFGRVQARKKAIC